MMDWADEFKNRVADPEVTNSAWAHVAPRFWTNS